MTYGKKVFDHHAKNITLEDDVIEYRRGMEKEIIHNINRVVQEALLKPQYDLRDFYIVILMRVEHIGQAARTFVFSRISCPTPVFKQSVWKYHRDSASLEFLWSIPDAILYNDIIAHPQKYAHDKETADLVKFVLLMESGELLTWVKKENGEKEDGVIQIKENYV